MPSTFPARFLYVETLPHRYSDFLVNEIDAEGNVVHLTSLAVPSSQNDSAASLAGSAPGQVASLAEATAPSVDDASASNVKKHATVIQQDASAAGLAAQSDEVLSAEQLAALSALIPADSVVAVQQFFREAQAFEHSYTSSLSSVRFQQSPIDIHRYLCIK